MIATASDHLQALGELPVAGTRPVDATTTDPCGYVDNNGVCYSDINKKLAYQLDSATSPSIATVFHLTAQHDTRYLHGTLRLERAAASCQPGVQVDVIILADSRTILDIT